MGKNSKLTDYIEYLIIVFIFLILFGLPVLFTRVNGEISWLHVLKIWQDQVLLIPVFAINHWLFAPKFLLRQKYIIYIISILSFIAMCSASYYYYDNAYKPQKTVVNTDQNKPSPIPPYAHLLMYALLIAGVDSGLLFSKKWHENEESHHIMEKKNSEMQLEMLRNQVSPHFLMNTLNNIYALIDLDSFNAKDAVMKLSRMMRYMLYENERGKVLISKEFEFIQSYIDLMRLRFEKDMIIELRLPEQYVDFEIPPLLFISFIENAFKHGTSLENNSKIVISFKIENKMLIFDCFNKKGKTKPTTENNGFGIENSISRLNLLYGEKHTISINSLENYYDVTLIIPIL